MKDVQDIWFRKAKEQGYRARSAFKLIEIDDRRGILGRGFRVLDAGAAPGSWTQVAAARVGESGEVCAFDLKEIDARGLPANVRVMQADLNELTAASFGGALFDAVISDMGPDTSGDPSGDSIRSIALCNALLDRLPHWLRRGGNLILKVYEGGGYGALLKRTDGLFDEVKGVKPESSRGESVEMFVVGKGYKGGAANSTGTDAGARRRGWGESPQSA
ncbi:MAG: RlmE family RNA methyltransferase [Phycisphaerales bacterium]|nr:RlmE family RNA methyltransferase [Phycisphaerales bacterium]